MIASTTLFVILIASLFVFVMGCALWFRLPRDQKQMVTLVDAFIFSVWLLIFLLLYALFDVGGKNIFFPWIFGGTFLALTGAVLGMVKFFHTELSRYVGTARLANSLKQEQKMLKALDAQKTEFLSIASHQLRTPLTVIKGYVELIGDGTYGKVTPQLKKVLKNVDVSNERLIHLVDEFLNLSRLEQGRQAYDFLPGDLNDIIANVIDELKPRAELKKIKLHWRRAMLPRTKIDADKIRHVVYNFLDNAIKYSNKGVVRLVATIDHGRISFQIKDQGVGFPPAEAEHFFEKFYRGDTARSSNVNGTGLGLYVCRKFIEAHDGTVGAKSVGLNKGSTFYFTLPIRNQ